MTETATPVTVGTLSVLHLRNSDRLGGPERLLLEQGARAGAGVAPVIASFGTGNRPNELLEEAGRRGVATLRLEQRGSYDPAACTRLARWLRERRPDVVVGHDYKSNLLLALAAGRLGIPRVAVVHGYTAEDAKVAALEAADRRLLRRTQAVVAVAAGVAQTLRAAGVSADRLHVVENGVDADRVAAEAAAARLAVRREWGLADTDVALLALGRLSPEKGQDVLLEACAHLPTFPCLVLVGDGASRAGLEATAAKHGLAARFAGWRRDPWRCLGAADVLVLPSRREGLPLAALEAMAVGLPVVASDVGVLREVLDDGRAGLVVPPGDAPGLAAALERVLADADLRRTLGAAAARRVRERYGADRPVRSLEALLGEVVLANRSRRRRRQPPIV